MSDNKLFRDRCCNPLGLERHFKKNIRYVSENLIKKFPALKGRKVCSSYNLKLYSAGDNLLLQIADESSSLSLIIVIRK